jgi:hypothetical protein
MNSPGTDHHLILDFLNHTNQPIFLTGKAGTGKTTLLKRIKETIKKNYAVVAPTAVAAINAGGVTLHSFFQIPFGPLPPIEEPTQPVKYSEDKTKLLRCLELLIIDEISMVRVDIIDFIDRTLKKVKGSNLPFGGVQVLMIGDLYQLSPIFHDAWHILREHYQSPYFFDGQVFRSTSMITFTLEKVYRQSDPVFLEILNKIRENTMDEGLLATLNERYDATLDTGWKEDYITLTTHNNLVSEINNNCLALLSGETYTFTAEVTGDFPKDAYPSDEVLELKVGAQIIFIKNDSSGKKQFYNGKAAKITHLSDQHIKVQFIDGNKEIEVEREIWQNVKYNLDQTDNKINEVNTGSFAQYPFKLAWAITVHKSQGLTFDQAIVDVSAAFAHGHAYVALSRCRSLEGLILKSPVKLENIITDPRVASFTASAASEQPSLQSLEKYTRQYGWSLIRSVLDFSFIQRDWMLLQKSKFTIAAERAAFFQIYDPTQVILLDQIVKIADRFNAQELSKIPATADFQSEVNFVDRLKKAAAYFVPKLENVIKELESLLELKLFNDPYSDRVFELLTECHSALKIKLALFQYNWDLFTVEAFITKLHATGSSHQTYERGVVAKKTVAPKEIINPKLFQTLMDWRKGIATQRNVPDHQVLSEQALQLIAAKLPKTTDQLAKTIGEGNAIELGSQITRMVNGYLGTSELF